jgi:hypothetical protein
MTAFSVNQVDELGSAALSYVSTTASDEFVNTGKEFIILKGHATVDATVVFTAQITNVRHPSFGNTTKANITIDLDSEQTKIVGPFKPSAFNDSDGKVKFATTMASGTVFPTALVCYLDDR